MLYKRMAIEKESPEELGYGNIRYNLAESSVSDCLLKDIQLQLGDLSLCYTDHRGKPALRELIARDQDGLGPAQVLLTAGAASALFIIASSLLRANDHLVVIRPNYATNIETPKAIGTAISYIDLRFEDGWQPDIDAIESAIRPNTKYISVTHPHNPTGVLLHRESLLAIIDIAERHNIYLLVDETYRELSFTPLLPVAAALSRQVISVSSVSKAYGLPGLRIGWLMTRNDTLMDLFLAAKEQIFITNSVLDEEVCFQFLVNKERYWTPIKNRIALHFSIIERWLQEEQRLEWVKPGGSVVCFPRIRPAFTLDTDLFYDLLLKKYGTLVGPGHWFDMPDTYMRIGYGWPATDELQKGLQAVSKALDESIRL